MEGNTLQNIHKGKLRKWKHRFDYNPNVTEHSTLVYVLWVDGKLEGIKGCNSMPFEIQNSRFFLQSQKNAKQLWLY